MNSKKSSPRHVQLANEFCDRLNAVLPQDYAAANTTAEIKVTLRPARTPTESKDTAIAGHTITTGVMVVTNNMREFVQELKSVFEDWVQ
ncbi:type II toxin-antitoxin system VapC family toxin [Escherichia coli]|uniref:hypothetical protein n=1 Tax=unclassified Escherichia TaxID=2608889 RepID=UPI000CF75AA1|nr:MULTISPECIES: hypothetical protein [unclassified Escherichia]EBJ0540276.1 hypothetical protein [Salmonella enterica]EDR1715295.1 type II toxin-antitoxin system VapC family toxin [Salmonella enterica subsp. enterica serovar Mississippi]EFH0456430.1 type II toxin-antitoxin system VapC family toxin [Escherichia coli]ECX9476505.1 type II toxin-antitoxin system VapC family toxin [Salmonella enterica]EEN7937909.1 type II toxin-antitoxin system VapC family toxin [Salmonella enterica]